MNYSVSYQNNKDFSLRIPIDSKILFNQTSKIVYCSLLIFIFTEFMGISSQFSILRLFHINTLIPIGGLGIFIFNVMTKRQRLIIAKQGWLFILFIILILLSFFHAYWTYIVFERFKVIIGYVIIYFLIVNHLDTFERIRKFIWVLILAHAGLILTNLDALLDVGRRSHINAGPFLGNGNDFALSLNLILPLAIFFVSYERKRWLKTIALFLTCVFTMGIFLTQSRGGILAFAGMALFLVFTSRHKIYAMAILIIAAIFLYFAFPNASDRMQTLRNYQEEPSARGRLDAWKASIKMAYDKPLTGVGIGNFAPAYGIIYRPQDAYHQYSWVVAHSMYFEILGELGLPGIIFLLLILFISYWDNLVSYSLIRFRNNYEDIRKFPVFLSAILISFMIGGAFLSCSSYPHLYIYSALIIVFKRVIRKCIVDKSLTDKNSAI